MIPLPSPAPAPPHRIPKAFRRPIPVLLAALLLVFLPGATSRAGGFPPAAAAGQAAPAARWQPRWQWPLQPPPPVLRGFDRPAQRWLAGHRGVDLSAGAGAAVVSPAAGTVHFAGWVVDRPVLTIRIEEAGTVLLSSFEPVDTDLAAGSAVAAGEPVGRVAVTAARHCPQPCLHWGVREDGGYVDPLAFVTDRRPSVLLPLPGPAAAAAARGRGGNGRPATATAGRVVD